MNNKLIFSSIAAATLATLINTSVLAEESCMVPGSCFPSEVIQTGEGRSVYAGGGFEAGAYGESRGLLGETSEGQVVTNQFAGSDNFAETYGNLELDISTCPGDECQGMRAGFNGYSRSGGLGWSRQEVTSGPAHAGADANSSGNISAGGFVVRQIND